MLFHVSFLEATNWQTVSEKFYDSIATLWPNLLPSETHKRIRLILTDQAGYMLKAFKKIKNSGLFKNLHHVTCLVHALHLAAEVIRKNCPIVDKLVSNMKKCLLKSPRRTNLFKQVVNIPRPPKPVLTRWAIWLEAAIYYTDNFEHIMKFISKLSTLKDKKTKSIIALEKLLSNKVLHDELIKIKKHKVLIANLKQLESQRLPVKKQLSYLQEVLSYIEDAPLEKIMESLRKNSDFYEFIAYNKSFDHKNKIEFAPLVSVDVERSFSKYKLLLAPNRMSLNEESIKMMMIISCNSIVNFN